MHSISPSLVQKWLKSRQIWIISFYSLCQHRPFILDDELIVIKDKLQIFCEDLIDYLSLGHFDLYEKTLTSIQRQNESPFLQPLLSRLLRTTKVSLDFNEKYFHLNDLKTLDKDLSDLAESLAWHLEYEDNLIKQLH